MLYAVLAIVAFALFCGWFVAMLRNQHFRTTSNYVWAHYFVHGLLPWLWPYALIAAAYTVISDGSLANVVRAAVGH